MLIVVPVTRSTPAYARCCCRPSRRFAGTALSCVVIGVLAVVDIVDFVRTMLV